MCIRDSFCTLPDGDEVNFYQLIPLYKEEMEFKLENSVDELIDKCPDEILEVINPTRLNAITDEDTIGYDLAEMDNAESHLKRIRDCLLYTSLSRLWQLCGERVCHPGAAYRPRPWGGASSSS